MTSAEAKLAGADAYCRRSLTLRVTELPVDLHPSRLADVAGGVREELDKRLLRYDAELQGVVMAYSHVRLRSNLAEVNAYMPYVRVLAAARLLVFQPRAGAELTGIINKVGADYVGLLVLGVFNAAIAAENMRNFRVVHLTAGGILWAHRKAPEHVLSLGDLVLFSVVAVHDGADALSLTGTAAGRGEGNLAYLEKHGLTRDNGDPTRGEAPEEKRKNKEKGDAVAASKQDRRDGIDGERRDGNKNKKKHKVRVGQHKGVVAAGVTEPAVMEGKAKRQAPVEQAPTCKPHKPGDAPNPQAKKRKLDLGGAS